MTPHTNYPSLLIALPRLVRRQRRLEKKIAEVEADVAREAATRASIDLLLIDIGCVTGQGVTCLGYDVIHNERKGRTSINGDVLLGAGVPAIDIALATTTGKAARFATVRPGKGAKVRHE